MAITERGQAGGGGGGGGGEGSDHGLYDSPWSDCKQNRCETICLKDFEVVTSWRGDVVRV